MIYCGGRVMKLSIVIPARNQEETLATVVERVGAVSLSIEKEIVIVDDGSIDGTRRLLETQLRAQVQHCLFQPKTLGRGAAIRAALRVASGDVILIQDAGGAYDPADYTRLLAPILAGRADVVLGSRGHGEPRQLLSFGRALGNRCQTVLSNLLTGLPASDQGSLCKVFRRGILQSIVQEEDGSGFDAELVAKLPSLPLVRVCEVGVSYFERPGKTRAARCWARALRTVWALGKYTFVRRRDGRTTWLAAIRLAAFVFLSLLLLQASDDWRAQAREKLALATALDALQTNSADENGVAVVKGYLPPQGPVGYFTDKGAERWYSMQFHFAPLQLDFGQPKHTVVISDFSAPAKDILAGNKDFKLVATFLKGGPLLRDLRIYKRNR